jgi:hypothetical protein
MDFKWLLKGFVESIFVVASILLALAVDEWSQDRDFAELADQSLGIFESEIRQNTARLADLSPYHQGIRDLLGRMNAMPPQEVDVRSIMEGLQTPMLLNAAWETALATGALNHMDFEVVSALSLTYSIQDGFQSRSRLERPRFVGPEGLSDARMIEQLDEAYEYVTSLTRDESELVAVYDQALAMIHGHRDDGHVDAAVAGRDAATPAGGS